MWVNCGGNQDENKRRYCVILYVGQFWPPNFGLISVQSLIYMPISMLAMSESFFCIPPYFVSACGHGVSAQYKNHITRIMLRVNLIEYPGHFSTHIKDIEILKLLFGIFVLTSG